MAYMGVDKGESVVYFCVIRVLDMDVLHSASMIVKIRDYEKVCGQVCKDLMACQSAYLR